MEREAAVAAPASVELIPGYPECYAALEAAKRFGFKQAAEVISNGGCYDGVFAAAVQDTGGNLNRVVEAVFAARNSKWAYYCALALPQLPVKLVRILAYRVILDQNPIWAYWFAQDVPNVPDGVRARLQEIAQL